MKKKLFKNYIYQFDKNEKKILTTFCKQALNQLQGDSKFYSEIKSFSSILDKLGSPDDTVKLTKDESKKLEMQLKENLNHIKKQMENSWFIKKWLYRSMYNQYNSLIINHFSD